MPLLSMLLVHKQHALGIEEIEESHTYEEI